MTSTLTGHGWFSTLRQFLRFGLVGGLNTIVDLLILNVLLWLFPTQHTSLLIIYNSIAYGIGTIDSFVLNKYWTFGHRKHTTPADGYNGLHRLLGTAFGSGNLPSSQASRTSPGSSPSSQQPSTVGGSGGGDGIFALIGTGGARVFRLFTQGMAGQISWLLPLALLGWLVAAWQTWRRAASRLPGNQQRQAIVLWGGWLLTMVIYFSVAGVVHSYYLTMLAPGIAATAAIGIVALWNEYRRPGRSGWLLPVILASTAIVQAYILSAYASWSTWMTPLILDLTLAAAAVLVIARLLPCWSGRRIAHAAVVGGMLALLIAPATWSAITTQHPGGLLPFAGPSSNQGSGGMGLFGGGSSGRNAALEKYLLAHQRRARFLVATQSAMTASPIILDTGKAVMAWGGFLGTDPILTTKQLASMVATGTVRFFLVMDGGDARTTLNEIPAQIRATLPAQILRQLEQGDFSFADGLSGSNRNSALTTWITTHCRKVPASAWQSSSSGSRRSPAEGRRQQLYDCASRH